MNSKNSLIFSGFYPHYQREKSTKPYRAVLGIGGNIGDVKRRFNHLFVYFEKSSRIDIIETSPILKNPPFGYLEQDDFHNSLIFVKTCLRSKALLRYILRIEKKFGRRRSFQDAPRTLDIDMIFYENEKIQTDELTLPHPAWKERDSVLVPLSQMKNPYVREKYETRSVRDYH